MECGIILEALNYSEASYLLSRIEVYKKTSSLTDSRLDEEF